MGERKILVSLLFLFFILDASAHNPKSKKTELRHQFSVFFTNALTGYTKGNPSYNLIVHKEPRYGFNTGIDYNVKFLKWLSVGTGFGVVFHRSFSSFEPIDSLPPAPSNFYSVHSKYSESTQMRGVIEIPLTLIFTICQKNKIEFQFAVSQSPLIPFYRRGQGYYIMYGSNEHIEYNYKDSEGENVGLGVSAGPVLKVGIKQGILIQPEFRLLQVLNESKSRAYSAGLRLGWFFNLN